MQLYRVNVSLSGTRKLRLKNGLRSVINDGRRRRRRRTTFHLQVWFGDFCHHHKVTDFSLMLPYHWAHTQCNRIKGNHTFLSPITLHSEIWRKALKIKLPSHHPSCHRLTTVQDSQFWTSYQKLSITRIGFLIFHELIQVLTIQL